MYRLLGNTELENSGIGLSPFRGQVIKLRRAKKCFKRLDPLVFPIIHPNGISLYAGCVESTKEGHLDGCDCQRHLCYLLGH